MFLGSSKITRLPTSTFYMVIKAVKESNLALPSCGDIYIFFITRINGCSPTSALQPSRTTYGFYLFECSHNLVGFHICFYAKISIDVSSHCIIYLRVTLKQSLETDNVTVMNVHEGSLMQNKPNKTNIVLYSVKHSNPT